MYRGVAYIPNKQLMRLFTWDETGKRIHYDCSYEPYIYLETNGKEDATSIFNTKLKKRYFRQQSDRYRYLKENDIIRIFENLPASQQFLVDTFWDKVDSRDFSKFPLKVYFIDIETYSPDSFPDVKDPTHPIVLITLHDSVSKTFYTWGTKPYTSKKENQIYFQCKSEKDLLDKFISHIEADYPDILSGYNCEFFDFPYIVNRTIRILGQDAVNRLSPIGRVYSRAKIGKFGKEYERWYFEGLSCIDYLDIYTKFCTILRENYKLNTIAEIELGETKVDYGDTNLSGLHDNNWETFVDYNIQDVNLLCRMEDRLRYLELLRMLSYAGCTTFESGLGTLSVVTGLCAIKARSKKLCIPTFNRGDDDGKKNEGAFVGEPQQGFQEHVVSFDANSLYPNVMITLNLSPETKIGKITEVSKEKITVQHVNGQFFDLTPAAFSKFVDQEKLSISKANILFSQKQKGIVPEIVDSFYQKRVEARKRHKVLEKKLLTLDPASDEYKTTKRLADYLDIRQFTIKILINSAYGYFGNKKAPLGDDDIARSITLTGQAVIKQSNEILKGFIKDHTATNVRDTDPIIYNDTDSVYISIKDIADHKNIKMVGADGQITPEYYNLVQEIEAYLNVGIKQWGTDILKSTDCRLVFKREIIADVGLFLQKKRYVVHMLDKEGIPCNKFKYTGVEVVRTTMPNPIKPHVKRIIETMLTTKSYTETNKVFTEAYKIFKSLPIEDIAFVMGLNGYEKYASQCSGFETVKRMPIHAKAAYFYNKLIDMNNLTGKYEKLGTGDKIRYFYVKQPNKYGLTVFGYKYYFPSELLTVIEPDHEKLFEKIVFSAIERFYQAVSWKLTPPALATQVNLFELFSD